MKTKLMSLMAGASLCTLVGAVQAAPVELSSKQMDQVSAGAVLVIFGSGLANAATDGIGNASVVGTTNTYVEVDPLGALNGVSHVTATASGGTISLSVVNPALGIGGAFSQSNAATAASMN